MVLSQVLETQVLLQDATNVFFFQWDNSICRWTYVEQIAPDVKPPRKKSKSSTGSEGEAEASGSQPRRSKRNRTAHSPT